MFKLYKASKFDTFSSILSIKAQQKEIYLLFFINHSGSIYICKISPSIMPDKPTIPQYSGHLRPYKKAVNSKTPVF